MPKKPIKRGIKVWVRADSANGYFCDFDVYTGASQSPEKGLGASVVKCLTAGLEGKHYQVFCAKFFFWNWPLLWASGQWNICMWHSESKSSSLSQWTQAPYQERAEEAWWLRSSSGRQSGSLSLARQQASDCAVNKCTDLCKCNCAKATKRWISHWSSLSWICCSLQQIYGWSRQRRSTSAIL